MLYKSLPPKSTSGLSSCTQYPPHLTEKQSEFLIDQIKDWSVARGLAFRPEIAYTEDDTGGNYVGAALRTYNQLYANVTNDEEWLGSIVQELVGIDKFIRGLWKTHLAVRTEGYKQDLSLGLFRSGYMAHSPNGEVRPTLRQVEFNTIASGMGGLSSRVSSLHLHLVQTASYPEEAAQVLQLDLLPNNPAVEGMGLALAGCHNAYRASKSQHPLCIVFIVQEHERNAFDQRLIEYSLEAQASIPVFRITFQRTLEELSLDENSTLLYSPPCFPERIYEVTTVYFRAGYSPDEYISEDSWAARLLIERSSSIKIPSVLVQLAGCKKVQQMLATPDLPCNLTAAKFEAMSERLRGTFAPMYPMDATEAGSIARELATDPQTATRFVLKPQREGGSNNVYRSAIPKFLAETPRSQWPAHILMEMIEPPIQSNAILRDGKVECGEVVCELGVFGAILWRSRQGSQVEVLENLEIGHVLRTKGCQNDEGGISVGVGALDSVCLVDT